MGSAFFFVVLASLLLILPGLVAPILTGLFVDRCLVSGNNNLVVPLLAGMLLTGAAGRADLAAGILPAEVGNEAVPHILL